MSSYFAPLNGHHPTSSNGTLQQYTPKSILLTGGTGSIGFLVVELLVNRYPHYHVVVLDKLDYCAAEQNISPLFDRPNLRWCRGDIRSRCLVDYLLRSENIDTIMHFAASTYVDNSFHSSISFTSKNVVGTHVLLESAREYGRIKHFIPVSTDGVYGGETDFEIEDSVMDPTNPYACTKAAAELICRGYANFFSMPIIVILRDKILEHHHQAVDILTKPIGNGIEVLCCVSIRRSFAGVLMLFELFPNFNTVTVQCTVTTFFLFRYFSGEVFFDLFLISHVFS
ncbi:hypothetical protein BWQ96_00992 [Gracilariopsis chorda]|uniref:NAD(P)-binding domain-containing protein n=1 Tax=Gracilariopsis chorda TaxID=448386 RepID=A0A2V3J4G6_9FLOR|nr:hypothetical protein BWQ96_00992 [Gracilariopsis chorda]|eukprot:PXF49203.1 hypothetical protein BWQ96_00992 [Gracilariopsis chorda]